MNDERQHHVLPHTFHSCEAATCDSLGRKSQETTKPDPQLRSDDRSLTNVDSPWNSLARRILDQIP
jgi:hypothetical protein